MTFCCIYCCVLLRGFLQRSDLRVKAVNLASLRVDIGSHPRCCIGFSSQVAPEARDLLGLSADQLPAE